MPFPLAHPAAVLPFRRLNSGYFNFAALVIGSITPDLGYCLERYDVDVLSHSIRGCLIFSLPVGCVLVAIFRAVGEPLMELLPGPHRQALLPACRNWSQPWFVVPVSLLVGAMTHVVWDSITHDTGWMVERSSLLQWELFSLAGNSFQLYRLLWHLSTWIGLFLIYRSYAGVVRDSTGLRSGLWTMEKRLRLLWMGLLLPPSIPALVIALARYAPQFPSGRGLVQFLRLGAAIYLVSVGMILVAVGAAMRLRRRSGSYALGSEDKGAVS